MSNPKTLDEAYLELRKLIPGAFDTPTAPTLEQVWKVTRESLERLISTKDMLRTVVMRREERKKQLDTSELKPTDKLITNWSTLASFQKQAPKGSAMRAVIDAAEELILAQFHNSSVYSNAVSSVDGLIEAAGDYLTERECSKAAISAADGTNAAVMLSALQKHADQEEKAEQALAAALKSLPVVVTKNEL